MSSSSATRSVATTVGRNIRIARLRAGLTQNDLAIELSIAGGMTVSNWERGVALPSAGNLMALAELFSCNLASFYAEEEQAA
jgi:transcriptional regulator with XRE-family HTH domain